MSKPISLDLKKFKHVKSDKDSTTLQHKDGHTLTIAHKSLGKDMQKQLAALAALGGKDDSTQADQLEAASEKPMPHFADGGDVPKNWVDNFGEKASAGWKNLKNELTPSSTPTPTGGDTQSVKDYKSQKGGTMNYACGGNVQKYAEGGDVDPTENMSVNPDEVNKQQAIANDLRDQQAGNAQLQSNKDVYNAQIMAAGGDPSAMFGPNGEPPKAQVNPQVWAMAKAAPDNERAKINQMRMNSQDAQTKQQQAEHDKVQAQNATNAELGLPPIPDPGAPALEVQPQAPQGDQLPPGSPQPQSVPQGMPSAGMGTDPESMLTKGYGNQVAGLQNLAKAQGDLGKQQAAALQQQQAILQQTQDHYQSSYNDLNQERQGLIKDIQNGYIDPEQYWKGIKDPVTGEIQGSHSKIAAGIGILLGGFNNRGGNPVLDNIHYQMDQNLKAQAQNLQAKDNLLGHNIRQFGNLKDGVMMTRIMQADMLQNQIAQAAAKSASPMAQANAQQAIGQIQQQYAPLFQQFAMRRAMMNLANGDQNQPGAIEHMLGYMRVMNPEMAKEMETRLVPGIGNGGASALASVPVPDAVRQQIVSHKSVNDLMNKALQFAQQHHGSLDPKVRAEAATIQMQLIGQVKQAQHDGVYKPSEAEFLTEQIGGSPASFLANISSVPKIRTMQQIKQSEYGNLLKTYGIAGAQLPQYQPASSAQGLQQAQQWLKQNPNHPKAAEVRQRIKAMSGK